MPKPVLDANSVVARMIAGAGASGQLWQTNAAATTQDAKAAAIANNAGYKAGVQAAIANDSYLKGVQNIDPNAVSAAIMATSPDAVASGMQRRQPALVKTFGILLPKLAAISQQIKGMPKATPTDRFNRMVANYKQTSALKGTIH